MSCTGRYVSLTSASVLTMSGFIYLQEQNFYNATLTKTAVFHSLGNNFPKYIKSKQKQTKQSVHNILNRAVGDIKTSSKDFTIDPGLIRKNWKYGQITVSIVLVNRDRAVAVRAAPWGLFQYSSNRHFSRNLCRTINIQPWRLTEVKQTVLPNT